MKYFYTKSVKKSTYPPTITFERNKQLVDLQTNINELGTLTTGHVEADKLGTLTTGHTQADKHGKKGKRKV